MKLRLFSLLFPVLLYGCNEAYAVPSCDDAGIVRKVISEIEKAIVVPTPKLSFLRETFERTTARGCLALITSSGHIQAEIGYVLSFDGDYTDIRIIDPTLLRAMYHRKGE